MLTSLKQTECEHDCKKRNDKASHSQLLIALPSFCRHGGCALRHWAVVQHHHQKPFAKGWPTSSQRMVISTNGQPESTQSCVALTSNVPRRKLMLVLKQARVQSWYPIAVGWAGLSNDPFSQSFPKYTLSEMCQKLHSKRITETKTIELKIWWHVKEQLKPLETDLNTSSLQTKLSRNPLNHQAQRSPVEIKQQEISKRKHDNEK